MFPLEDQLARGERELERLRSDVIRQETIALYPGGLIPEDFVAKIVRRVRSAELRGLPFTGILIDGIHNVFLQFPDIEHNPGVWPQTFSLLRKYAVSVVTTHTDFQIGRGASADETAMLDARAAQAKAAPLLSVLVSAGDYVLDVLPVKSTASGVRQRELRFEVITRESLEGVTGASRLFWDRDRCIWYNTVQRGSQTRVYV